MSKVTHHQQNKCWNNRKCKSKRYKLPSNYFSIIFDKYNSNANANANANNKNKNKNKHSCKQEMNQAINKLNEAKELELLQDYEQAENKLADALNHLAKALDSLEHCSCCGRHC